MHFTELLVLNFWFGFCYSLGRNTVQDKFEQSDDNLNV